MAGLEHDRLTTAESVSDDRAFDRAIRPKSLDEYVGQPGVKQQMGIFIEAARRRSEASPTRWASTCGTRPGLFWSDPATWQRY